MLSFRCKSVQRVGLSLLVRPALVSRCITNNVLISTPLDRSKTTVPQFSSSIMGHLAKGSAFCYHGNCVVHVAVCSKVPISSGDSFLPLTVDFRSLYTGLGKIPSNNVRRERETDQETLASRVIDRSLRPLFPKYFRDETQITATVHAVDGMTDPIVLAVNAASFALLQTGLPWHGPVGCVRVGQVDGELIANPTLEQLKQSTLDLLYAGTEYRTTM